MKAYIDVLLENKASKEEIFYRIAKKFSLNTIIDKELKSKIEKRLIQEAGQKYPRIIIEPLSFDFKRVTKKQGKVSKIFKIYNKGNSNLIINNIRVSCNCVMASLRVGKNKSPDFGVSGAGQGWEAVVEPGRSGELEVTLDLVHPSMGSGKQRRDIFISSNDPVYPQITTTVEIELSD